MSDSGISIKTELNGGARNVDSDTCRNNRRRRRNIIHSHNIRKNPSARRKRCHGISSWDGYDDTCGICANGGNLICCDGCPSTFHENCLGVKVPAKKNWYCTSCLCKFCGVHCNNVAPWFTCYQCERKYHGSCNGGLQVRSFPTYISTFCGMRCRELFHRMQRMIGVRTTIENGLFWVLYQNKSADSNGMLRRETLEHKSKLSATMEVMNEAFEPITDRLTGTNIMQNVVYSCGSNFNRLNFRGFCTAILENEDEIISVACIRIRGTKIAEMPFIVTRNIYRRQGMCGRLLNALSAFLSFLGVEKLIIPSVRHRVSDWIQHYQFFHIEKPLKEKLQSMNILTFPQTVLLQRFLINEGIPRSITTDRDGDGNVRTTLLPRLDFKLLPARCDQLKEKDKHACDADQRNDNGIMPEDDKSCWGAFLTLGNKSS